MSGEHLRVYHPIPVKSSIIFEFFPIFLPNMYLAGILFENFFIFPVAGFRPFAPPPPRTGRFFAVSSLLYIRAKIHLSTLFPHFINKPLFCWGFPGNLPLQTAAKKAPSCRLPKGCRGRRWWYLIYLYSYIITILLPAACGRAKISAPAGR